MCSCKITDPYIKSLSPTWHLYYNRWILRIASVVGGSLCSLSITMRPCQGGELQYLYKLRSLIPLQPVKKGTNVFSTTIAALTE